jgi:hypothetical protein
VAVAGEQAHARAVPPRHDAEAVLLDLVNLFLAGWRPAMAGLDEAGRGRRRSAPPPNDMQAIPQLQTAPVVLEIDSKIARPWIVEIAKAIGVPARTATS